MPSKEKLLKSCIAYIDGGSRGNPGIAGYGVHLMDEEGKTLASVSERWGRRTDNFAELSTLMSTST